MKKYNVFNGLSVVRSVPKPVEGSKLGQNKNGFGWVSHSIGKILQALELSHNLDGSRWDVSWIRVAITCFFSVYRQQHRTRFGGYKTGEQKFGTIFLAYAGTHTVLQISGLRRAISHSWFHLLNIALRNTGKSNVCVPRETIVA